MFSLLTITPQKSQKFAPSEISRCTVCKAANCNRVKWSFTFFSHPSFYTTFGIPFPMVPVCGPISDMSMGIPWGWKLVAITCSVSLT